MALNLPGMWERRGGGLLFNGYCIAAGDSTGRGLGDIEKRHTEKKRRL